MTMRRLVWGLVGLAVLAWPGAVGAGEPPPPVFDHDAAQRELEGGRPSAQAVQALLAEAARAVSRRVELADEAAARGRVSFSVAAQAKVENHLGLGASAGVGTQGGAVGLGHRLLRFKGGVDGNERTVTSQIEFGVAVLPDGSLVKRAYSVALEYGDNRTFLGALGMDGRSFPGMATTIQAMDRLAGREAEEVRTTGEPPSVTTAVRDALLDLVPEMFHRATEFKSATVASGTIVENKEGSLSVQHMSHERLEAGQAPGEGRKWSEATLGAEIEAPLAASPLGTVSGGVALELKRTYGDPPPVDPAAGRDVTAMFARGDLTGLLEAAQERLAPVVDPERWPRVLEALDQQGVPGETGSGRALGVHDDVIGGVRLQYDPALLKSSVAPAKAARLLDRLLGELDAGRQDFVVGSEVGGARLDVVSLAGLLRAPPATLGRITRVRGFVRTPDDLLLLGEAEDGAPPLLLDALTVAVRAIWREGQHPFVSLDPDPDDFLAPHHARVGGLPETLKDTGFVLTLLEADYAMKRLNLGDVRVDVPDYQSLIDLLREGSPSGDVMARSWLSPMRSTVADVWTHAAGERETVLFDTRVQVLSESMRRTRDGLMGSGDSDPFNEAAADELTGHYDEISRHLPVFAALRGMFSLAKLCAILRARGVASPLLDRVADRTPARVEVPKTWPGLRVEDGRVQMSGGATTRLHLAGSAFREAPELAQFDGVEAGSTMDAEFPATLGLSGREAREADGEIHASRGLQAFEALELEACERHMDAALERDAGLVQAALLRGVCRFARGALDEAQADLDAVTVLVPQIVGLRALVHTLAGRESEAARDLAEAAARFPEDDDVASWRAQAHIYRGEFREAERIVRLLVARQPTDTQALALWDMLGELHRLGPVAARERVAHMRAVPLRISEACADGIQALTSLDAPRAVERLTQALAWIAERPEDPHVRALNLRERSLMCLVFAARFTQRIAAALPDGAAAEAPQGPGAGERAAELLTLRPDWPSAHLVALMVADGLEDDQIRRRADAALALSGEGDALLADMSRLLGTTRARAWVLFTLFYQAVQKNASPALRAHLLERTVEALGSGTEATLLGLLRDESVPMPKAAVRLREALLALPTPLPSEPLAVFVAGFCAVTWMGLAEEHVPSERTHVPGVARWLLQATDVDDLPAPAWMPISMFRIAALKVLSDEARAARSADAEPRKLRLAIVNLRAPLADLRARVRAHLEAVRARESAGLGPFLAEFGRLSHDDPLERELFEAAASVLLEVPEGSERDAYAAELDAWRLDLIGRVGVGHAQELAALDAGETLRAREGMLRRLESIGALARRPAEAQMLATLARLLSAGLPALASRDPHGAALMQQALERLVGGTGKGGEPPRPRDWSAFVAGGGR